MNLVAGEVAGGAFTTPGWSVPLPYGCRPGPVVLGVRAEDLTLAVAESGANGRVRIVEHLGSDTMAVVSMDHGDVVVRTTADTRLVAGDQVMVSANAKLHLFEPDDEGARLAPDRGADAA